MLVGLPGAGKSTVGEALAARLGRPFVDLDQSIERLAGRTVPEIFGTQGEAGFRDLEVEATRELAAWGTEAGPAVVAAGGGWMSNLAAVALLRPVSRIIHLRVSPERALLRLGGSVARRPLLAGPDSGARLEHLSAGREAAYRTADLEVDTDLLEIEEVTSQIVQLAGVVGRT